MTLLRVIVVLVGGVALLLLVVILRAETTRLHYAGARCERAADEIRQQVVEAELELARLRNPTRIRQRMEQAVGPAAEEPAPAVETPRRRVRH
jgi:hypothetical protein